MSHIVEVRTEVRDPAAIAAACQRLQLPAPVYGKAQFFSQSQTGWQVQLPGWQYPIVVDVTAGAIRFDNFEGRWGDPRQLSRFLQGYAAEKAKLEARRRGHTVTEQTLTDGSIKLTIRLGGAA